MMATCAQCGYKLPVIFTADNEMQAILHDAGWLCVYINHHWHTVCPACRKAKRKEVKA